MINNKILLKKLENLNFLENLRINKNYPSTIVLNFRETKLLAYTYINQKKYFVGENRNFIDSNILKNDKKYITKFMKNFSIDLNKKFILITGHRRENFGSGFVNICDAIKLLSELEDIN